MGISGLLPALKSIQVTRKLHEFAGQTLGVDAYVWLHRGILTCATELATGTSTHRYVDYAMHRMRLLRHHNIEPYVVFDGGPLPAKKGTEVKRKQQRDESLSRGNALAAQGKHSQARDYYVKSVDVTPQMAYQFIKALKAESISYVVAPYEADAQLTYLERIGLINGVLTEDSDLLVFGCQNVLLKLDTVSSTVVSITRKDFGSVTASASDSNGISLVGWSDVQFRAMAILSGCDYLPSIPGIGLKTACTLLRKWRTVEQVLRVIRLDGKKSVPEGYLERFRLAEKCFLYQRVYCPKQEKLVYLTEVDEDWSSEDEAHVGSDLEPSLAKQIAVGDVDPTTLLPMDDININFVPRGLKSLVFASKETNRPDKGKSKAKDTPVKEGILSFFGPSPKIPPRERRHVSSPIVVKKSAAGKASGKRTLAEVMDQDIAFKQKRTSKFFRSPTPKSRNPDNGELPIAGPSRLKGENKENICIVIDDEEADSAEEVGSNASVVAQGDVDPQTEMDLDDPSWQNIVEQEDGYISPTPSCSGDAQDFSSPIVARRTPVRKRETDSRDSVDRYFGVEAVSSPPSPVKLKRRRLSDSTPRQPHRTRSLDFPRARDHGTQPLGNQGVLGAPSASQPKVDLRHSFGDDRTSDIDCSDDDKESASGSHCSATPTPSPLMPLAQEESQTLTLNEDSDPEDSEARANELRKQAVIIGWKERWALDKAAAADIPRHTTSKLKRRETNVTPAGKHTLNSIHARPRPYPPTATSSAPPRTTVSIKPRRVQSRKSLPFLGLPKKGCAETIDDDLDIDIDEELNSETVLRNAKLEHYRFG